MRFGVTERNITDQTNQSAQIGRVEVLPCVHFGQNAFADLATRFPDCLVESIKNAEQFIGL